mgnify:CR=1 FL=1
MSLPVRECGLKFLKVKGTSERVIVTPRAGVWIEIALSRPYVTAILVTPRAGVWIEIMANILKMAGELSHSPCGSVD